MNPGVLAAYGLAALAAAMGIGRFAFTPVLPMMLAAGEVSLADGGWLAAANYAGYLAGALSAARLPGRLAIRAGLAGIALGTLAMALEPGFAAGLVLRALAGVASAWVLIHVSACCLERLPPRLHGAVFSGVGVGIAVAGLVCLPLSDPSAAWLVLGVLAIPIALVPFRAAPSDSTPRDGGGAASVLLVLCYGAFGFGYIIPATFIPAMAREMLGGAALFGWAWPLLGAAAALSTVIAPRIETRRLWSNAHLVMALGVVSPFVFPAAAGVLLGALLVGGTFMVITMAGLKEGRHAGGPRLMAQMTAAFAAGQIAGPALVAVLPSLLSASLAACALLAASGLALRFSHDRAPAAP